MLVTDESIKKLVGNVLKYGVRTVLCVGILGGIVYLFKNASKTVDYSQFKENDQNILDVLNSILHGVSHFEGSSIIYLGIIILFCTPLIRVLLSLVSFILEKDRLYVFITLLVIIIISISVYFGFGH